MPILAFSPRWLLFGGWFCSHLLLGTVWSAELGQAKVSAILRDVQKTEGSKTEPAAVGDVIAGGGKITTQGQSLAELKFPDGSVIRIGNNSTFSFDPNDRTVRLDRGTALVSTPPKAEGINIVSGGVTGTVGGDPAGKTFLVTAYPAEGGGAKGAPTGGFGLMVLQGSSTTTVSAPSGSVSIAPGQFALVGGKMDGAPKVLTVDVGQVFRSSPLVNSFPEPLPTKGAILSTAIQQQGSQSSGGLRSTGTTGVALTSGGDLLTGGSKPAKSGGYTFEIASNTPGTGRQERQATANEKNKEVDNIGLDIATAAGGPAGGGPLPVTGSTGSGGGGGGGFNVPSIPSTPVNTGQSGITANPNNPNNGSGSVGNVTTQPKPAVVIGASVASKVYDGNQAAAIFGATAGGISPADSVSLQNDTTGVFASKNVGNWAVSTSIGLVGLDAGKYVLTQPSLSGTITAKDLSVFNAAVTTKVYDGNNAAVVTGAVLTGNSRTDSDGKFIGAETVTLNGGTAGTFASKNVGAGQGVTTTMTLGGSDAGNYTLNTQPTLNGTITAKGLSITAPSIASKLYDGNASAGNVTLGALSGFVGSEIVTASGAAADYSSANVGTYYGVAVAYKLGNGSNGGLASNYSLASGSATGVITAKGLSITAPSIASKVYNGNTTAGSLTLGTLSGFVGRETVTASGAAADYSSANVGIYNGVAVTYTLSNGSNGGLASNYSLAAGSATGVITAKDVTIATGSVSGKVYDGNTGAVVTAGSLSGLVVGENLGTTTAIGTFASKDVGTRNVAASYTLTDGADLASNYNLLNPTEALSATITAKALTMTGSSAAAKVYDGSTTASVTLGALSGEVAGETLGTSTVVGTFNSKDVLGASTVTAVYTLVNGSNGELASNYSLANDALASTITAKVLTISLATPSTVTSKVYNGNTVASVTVGALDGEVAGETLGATTAVGTFADKNIGTKNVAAVYALANGSNGELASNYALAAETLTGTITAKDLSVFSAAVTTKVYDGNDTAVVTGAVVVGNSTTDSDGKFIGTETVTLSGETSGNFVSKNVGNRAVTTAMTLSGSDAGNYTLNTQPTLSGTITAKALTMTGSSAVSKVYDGNTTASVTLGTLSGEVAGETLGTSTVVGTFNSKDVVAANNVTAVYTLTDGVSGELASNYSLANDILASTITAKALTMTGSSAVSKVYDGNTTASVTLGTLSGEVAGETLGTSTVVGTFNSKDVLAASTVTSVYTLTDGLNGELASNYSLANDSLASTITAKALTMTGSTAASKVYDGNTTASVTLGALSGEVAGETLGTSTVVGTFNSKDVLAANNVAAVYTLTDGLNGELASNYSLANDSLASTITAKGLTMTGSSAATKVYDGNTTASVTLGTLSGEVLGETLGTSAVVGTFNSKDVLAANNVTAVYTLTDGISGELASNYTLANDSLASTITAKALTMTGSTAATKVYDGNTTASVTLGTLSGEVVGETLGTSAVVGTFNSKDVLNANTVTAVYTLTDGLSGELASNYSLANDSLASTITAKALTMTGSTAASKVYDGNTTASVTLGTLSGEVAGETLGTSTVVGTFNSKDVLAANAVTAVYTLTDGLSGELASNYSLANDSLASTITAKALTMTGSTAATKVYDGNTTASVTLGTLSGEVAGETLGTSTVVGTFNSKDVLAANTVNAVYTLADGSNGELASNYSLANDSLASTITAKALTMTGSTAATKVYDGNRTASVTLGALSGEVVGETLGTSTVVGTFNSKDVLAANAVTAVYTLMNGSNGELASNYSLASDSLASTITAKALTMTGSTAATKVYDGNTTASVTLGTLGGEVAGETLGASTVVGTFNSKDVLAANTVTAVYTLSDGLNGELASNYSLVNDSLASTITAKALSISAPLIGSKIYDGTTTAGSLSLGALSGFVGSETVTAAGSAANYSSANVGSYNSVVTYALTDGLNGGLASNYSLAAGSATGLITAKALTISVATPSTVTSKVYNGTRDAAVTVGALDGLVAGEALGATTVVGTFADKNIGTKNVAAVYTLVNGSNGELASNYTLAGETLTGTIMAKDLSVFSAVVTTKDYDGNDTAVVTGAVLVGNSTTDGDGKFIGTETVTLNGATGGTFVSKNVGAGQGVTTTMTLGGSDAGNYTLNTQPTLSGTITAKALTISVATPSTVASKVYNGTRDAAVTVGALDGVVAGEALGATTVVGTFADKNIGTKNVAAVYTLVNGLNGELASNYSLAGETLTGTITAKDLSVFSAAVTTKVYDGNDTAVVTGAVLVGSSTSDSDGKFIGTETVTLNGGTAGTFASKNVGAGQGVTTTMTLGGSDAGNYTLNTQPTLSGTITAKALTMTGSSAASKVYDGNRTASVTLGTLSGAVAGETLGTSTVVGTFNSKDVVWANTVTAVYTLVDGANGELASNYSLVNDSLASTITAKSLSISAPSIGSKPYDGLATAGSLTLGTLSGFVGSETVTASGVAADFSSANVGTYNGVVVTYTLGNGSNGGLASNYSLAAGSATGVITAKDVTIASGSVSGKVYDGNTGAVVTAGSLSGLVLGESLGTTTAVGTFASKDVGTQNVAASYTLTDGANLAANYNLLNPTETLSAAITAKGLAITAPSIASKKYDGSTASGAVTVGTLSGFVGSEIVTAAGSAANYSSANVGSYSSAVTYTLSDGPNGDLASNYSLAAGSATGAITAKDLVVNAAGITVGKIYDGGTSINPATQVAIGLGALTGSSTGANDGNYIGTEAVTLAVDAAGVFERNLPGTMIPISTTVKLASGNAVNNNYTLRGQPTGLTGEITGIANLNQNGVGISVSSADYIHIRNTTASRMQDGLSISSATGSVLLENSSFDGWMQRSTPNQTISDGGATTFTFTETASIAVNSPVLRVKMEANNPANVDMNKQFMLLGDYQVLLRRDPNGAPGSGDEVATTLFSFPGSANDPNGFGSMAPSADLVIRDSATTQVKDLPWNTKEYSSLNGSGAAVDSGNYAAVQGEFKGDNAASALDINTASGGAVGKWDVTVSDPILGGEGKVTDVRLKYNNNTKALIQGPNGVRLVNVIFEGMDEVEVGAGLNDKVLMSGTLVSDPNIGKMVVKAGQTLEAQFASDATMKEVRTSAGNAEILAGVVKDPSSPTGLSFIAGANRVLEMQTATIAGQLSLASHTIVFNNANITSGGVIDARTRDGMVNRTYGSVVPGTVSFMGANGNTFLNTANSASMSIANSGNIVSALSGGQMRENGVGGATVMNVGRVR